MSLGAQTTTVWRNLLPQWPHLRFRPKHNRSHQYSSGKNKKFLNSLYRATTAEHYRRRHSQSLKGNRNKILSLICAACSRFFTGNFYDRSKSEKAAQSRLASWQMFKDYNLPGPSFLFHCLTDQASADYCGLLIRQVTCGHYRTDHYDRLWP